MAWFAAHAVMYFRLKSGEQQGYRVWENVLLVQANDSREAWERGIELARRDEGDSGGSLRIADQPCELVFGGLRKVVEVSHVGAEDVPQHGDEISYSEFEVASADALRRLIDGDDVAVEYLG
jgi:Domain of unknown function (DUF4288)